MDTAEAASNHAAGQPSVRRHQPFRRALRELALVAALFLAYKAGRLAAVGRVSQAMDNAETVWRLQQWLHLPNEVAIQNVLLAHDLLVYPANLYYACVHFPATICCLVWLYVRRPTHYRWTRRMLAWLTAAALVVHLLVPLAPPRLAAVTGMVDTGSLYGPAVYGPPASDALSNQYAAMPSLHVGWAVIVAIALIAVSRGRWRWLWLAHPAITLLVVVGTGNHYWLDAIVVVAMLTPIIWLLPRPVTTPRVLEVEAPYPATATAAVRADGALEIRIPRQQAIRAEAVDQPCADDGVRLPAPNSGPRSI